MDPYPKRIVCLTSETVETLYLLGAEDRIVGITGFANRPKLAKKEKPIVSTFNEAAVEKILELKPDLVLGHSDVQADIAHKLISAGLSVWINNYRSIEGIFDMVHQLGALVGKSGKAEKLVREMKGKINEIETIIKKWDQRPKVYFEEWYEPLVTGIGWVSEIVELAGGKDIFPEHKTKSLAKDRKVDDAEEVVRRNPDIILASWCGKKLNKERMLSRKHWQYISAIKEQELYDIPSDIILQPGPAAILEGLPSIHGILSRWIQKRQGQSQ